MLAYVYKYSQASATSGGCFHVRHPGCVVWNYKCKTYIVICDSIKVYFLHCFVQRRVSTLIMSRLQVDYFS